MGNFELNDNTYSIYSGLLKILEHLTAMCLKASCQEIDPIYSILLQAIHLEVLEWLQCCSQFNWSILKSNSAQERNIGLDINISN